MLAVSSRLQHNDATDEQLGRFGVIGGGEINYQIIGREGPWVAVIQGGRHPLADLKGLAQKIAAKGYRVLIHDRRNCGQSSVGFDNLEPEDDFWADDLYSLLIYLNAKPAFVVGRSRGNRIIIRLVERSPDIACGIIFWGLSGGSLAVRFLDEYYYGQYLRACRRGGMAAVCALEHFRNLIAARAENRNLMHALDPAIFHSTMSQWRKTFLVGKDQPVMGVSDGELRRINIPTTIVPYYDRMHPYTTSAHAHKTLPNSRFFDFNPLRRESMDITPADVEHDEDVVVSILCEMYKK